MPDGDIAAFASAVGCALNFEDLGRDAVGKLAYRYGNLGGGSDDVGGAYQLAAQDGSEEAVEGRVQLALAVHGGEVAGDASQAPSQEGVAALEQAEE